MNPVTGTTNPTEHILPAEQQWSDETRNAATSIFERQVQLAGHHVGLAAALWLLMRIPGQPWATGRAYDLLSVSRMHSMRVTSRWGWEWDQTALFFICRMLLNDCPDIGLKVLLTAITPEEGELVATAVRIASGGIRVPGFEVDWE